MPDLPEHIKRAVDEVWNTLPLGGSKRIVCCGTDRSRICSHNAEKFSSYCFRPDCPSYFRQKSGLDKLRARNKQEAVEEAKAIRKDFSAFEEATADTSAFHHDAMVWLTKAGIHVHTIQKYGIRYNKDLHRVLIPMWDGYGHSHDKLLGFNARTLHSFEAENIKYVLNCPNKGAMFMIRPTDKAKSVILTEDMLSAIRIAEVVHLHTHDVDVGCIMGTSVSKYKLLSLVSKYRKIELFLDGDHAGRVATEQWTRELDPFLDITSILVDGKDPKHLTNEELSDILCHWYPR